MHITHIASEMAGIAKVGGLADSVLGLLKAHTLKGHDVKVILPKYPFIDLPSKIIDEFTLENEQILVHETTFDQIRVILLDFSSHFSEEKIYLSNHSDIHRFIRFTLGALLFLQRTNQHLDILHLHDWHTAIGALMTREKKLPIKKIVLSIHNLCYQGVCKEKDLSSVGIPVKKSFHQSNFFLKRFNLLKCGLVHADKIVAVSPTYAKEILTKRFSHGLLSTLQEQKAKITGILNGIDEEMFNPANDQALEKNYSKEDLLPRILSSKKENKKSLQKKLGLSLHENTPLIACISRLVHQKGPKLIQSGLIYALKKGAQVILIGSSPVKSIQRSFENMKNEYALDPNIHLHLRYNEELARLTYAAADFVIMPSFFEPCGITQLIALRYGALPIVRETGGLKDTVQENVNGFTFLPFTKSAFHASIQRALDTYEHDMLKEIIKTAMHQNHSWKDSAEHYEKMYSKLLGQ